MLWAGEDLNLRRLCRRVYSPFPLATRAPTQRRTTLPGGEGVALLISGATEARDGKPCPSEFFGLESAEDVLAAEFF